MRKLILILMIVIGVLLTACGMQTRTSQPSATKTPILWPTATYRSFRTIAPDNVATATPTPTAKPLPAAPLGRIAFQSDRSGSLDIYVMNADGTQTSRLTTEAGVEVFPAWSPDGERIAFTADTQGSPDIYVMNADGTDLQRIVDNSANDVLPAWSPDGERIAFVSDRDGNDEIYVMDTNGGDLKRLTRDSASDDFPSWSPDGEWLVFSSTRDVNAEIYKMDKNGRNLIRLTDDPAADSTPAWSPDGSRIAFVSKRDGFANLFVMDVDGKNVVQLTYYKSIVEVPSWSQDGSMIAFASDMEGSRDIFIIGAAGEGLQRLTFDAGEEFYPAWSPEVPFLTGSLAEPSPAAGSVCLLSNDPSYGYSLGNPVRLGYDPREEGDAESGCLPWLLGPQGQSLQVELLEEIEAGGSQLCKVSISYDGKAQADVMYFDTKTFEQPRAPIGYSCGSPVEYLKAIFAARY